MPNDGRSLPPLLIIVRGPLGVGKTTVAHAVARRLHARYVSIDRILDDHRLIRWRRGRIALVSFRRANSVALRDVERASARSRPVVIDGNFYYIGQIRDLVCRAPVPPRFFDLQAPLALCIARDAARLRSYGPEATRTVYRLNARYTFGETIDAARPLHWIVDEILRRIRVPFPVA